MEIQVKYTLAGMSDYEKLASFLKDKKRGEIRQENHFFDGTNDELASCGAVFRLRILPTKCEATIKENATMDSGSALRWAETTSLSVEQTTEAIRSPNSILHLPGQLFQTLCGTYKISEMKYLGCFRNRRELYEWNSDFPVLHLDTTDFNFGTVYEVEVCNSDFLLVSDIQTKLGDLMLSLGIEHRPSSKTKFDCFVSGSNVT